jgi:dienelactone hydrolase
VATVNWGIIRGAGALLLTFVAAGPLMAVDANFTNMRRTSLFFESAGKKVAVDLYAPRAPRSGRTILVLHGAGGMFFDGPRMRRVARAFGSAGDTVYLLHYFDRTRTIVARDATMQTHFEEWLGAVRDGVSWAHARENNRARPIGIYGYSLGGFLAIAAASDNPRVGAVAVQAGGIWNLEEKRVGHMPPVLVIHGLADERVPFEKFAKSLLRVLRARAGRVETDFVPNQGHVFTETAMKAVRPKAAEFFAKELGI